MEASLRKIHMKIFSRFNNKGFTLIELLAVIAIIAILAAMGLVAYSSAQRNARNSKRVGDMKAIQSTFEQYAANNNGAYAACGTMDNSFPGGVVPTDPTQGQSYVAVTCNSTTTYCYCARLEPYDASTKKAGNATAADCSSWSNSGGTHYCVTSQQ